MDDERSPAVSVILPAYQAEAFVEGAVRSVLAQDFPDFELIAIDDGSTDGTGDCLDVLAGQDARLRVLHQPNGGLAAARNTGLAMARGRMLAFIDADDLWAPELLTRMTAELDADPAIDIAFPRHRHSDIEGRPTGQVSRAGTKRYCAADLMIDNPIHCTSGCVMRQGAARAAGEYDVAMPSCIDVDFFARAVAGRGKAIGAVDAVLATYRRHPGQITADWRRLKTGWDQMTAKAAAGGYGPEGAELRRMRARIAVVWATAAYQAGDYAAARRLMVLSLSRDPVFVLRDSNARIRAAAVIASFLPGSVHVALRTAANGTSKRRTRG